MVTDSVNCVFQLLYIFLLTNRILTKYAPFIKISVPKVNLDQCFNVFFFIPSFLFCFKKIFNDQIQQWT